MSESRQKRRTWERSRALRLRDLGSCFGLTRPRKILLRDGIPKGDRTPPKRAKLPFREARKQLNDVSCNRSVNMLVIGAGLVGEEDARAHVKLRPQRRAQSRERERRKGKRLAIPVHASVDDHRALRVFGHLGRMRPKRFARNAPPRARLHLTRCHVSKGVSA